MSRYPAFVVVLLLAGVARAAPFADPTQPPAARDASNAGGTPGGPRIESILIAPDRRLAVIDGQQVTIGSRVGSGSVVRITETQVVVRDGEGEQTLKLFPELATPAKKGTSK